MASTTRWTEWHLTPYGWIEGAHANDATDSLPTPPQNRFATFRWVEELTHSKWQKKRQQIWVSDDAQSVQNLLKRFGPSPESL
jgi:hypothetical protein